MAGQGPPERTGHRGYRRCVHGWHAQTRARQTLRHWHEEREAAATRGGREEAVGVESATVKPCRFLATAMLLQEIRDEIWAAYEVVSGQPVALPTNITPP